MELISQHTKKIMEECKVRARDAGLRFSNESLEYIVTNLDLLELKPKIMVPTLYDYWVQDLEVIREKGIYEVFPHNPYETVINSRPAISFYNDNNPDWINVIIFYHVLGHIDFFQNNMFFRNTWDDDFVGKALADKRVIANLRSEHGQWVDYVIEFTRGIDNLVGYHRELSESNYPEEIKLNKKADFYFGEFLQTLKKVSGTEYAKEITKYNESLKKSQSLGESMFFSDAKKRYPEFDSLLKKHMEKRKENPKPKDVIEYLIENSPFLNKERNKWMKSVMRIVRNTSLYFEPQIRTKILNEGWASYWHENLFLQDDRMKTHEVGFATFNTGVVSLRRIGLNPYAIGKRLIEHIEEMADKGRISYDFRRINDTLQRKQYDKKTGKGRDFLFNLRENYCDLTLINTFIDQDFVDRHGLFAVGKKTDDWETEWQYYIKSRKAEDYKKMLLDQLYHPPNITVNEGKTTDAALHLVHHFEGKQLLEEDIPQTMLGLEWLWGGHVKLATTQIVQEDPEDVPQHFRVLYTARDGKIHKKFSDIEK